MNTKHFLFLANLCMLLLTSSCLAVLDLHNKTGLQYGRGFQNGDDIEERVYPEKAYTGLESIIAKADTTNILLIHGIKSKSPYHFKFFREQLVKGLGDYNLDPTAIDTIYGDAVSYTITDTIRPLPGRVIKYSYHKFFKRQQRKTIIFYDIHWAPATGSVKRYFRQHYDEPKQQTQSARYLKDVYLIDAFGDMALYLNEHYKKQIQKPFIEALKNLNGENNVVIAGGFGSQILFDVLGSVKDANKFTALMCLKKEIKEKGLDNKNDLFKSVFKNHPIRYESDIYALNSFIDSLATVPIKSRPQMIDEKLKQQKDKIPSYADLKIENIFLLSNQLPFTSLLSLKNNRTDNAKSYTDNLYFDLMEYACRSGAKPLNIVSFYDSNDGFGYKLPPSFAPTLNVVNVQIENSYNLSFNPVKLTRDYISPRIKDPKVRNQVLPLIDQEHMKQKLVFNFEGPAEYARYSSRIVKNIIHFNGIDSLPASPKVIPNPPKKKKGRGKRFLEGIAVKGLENALREIDVSRSTLPFRLPSNQILDFDGIRKSTEVNEVTKVLTVHGMRYAKPNHFDAMITLMAKQLDFYEKPTCDMDYYFDETCEAFVDKGLVANHGTIRIMKFENANGKSLVFYDVYWAPITLPPKKWLNDICHDASASITSQKLKEEIVNDGLGDVLLAFNGFKENIFSLVDKAIYMMNEEVDPQCFTCGYLKKIPQPVKKNTFMISGSLGSRILYEYLLDTKRMAASYVDSVLVRTDKIFMLTNQLRLIGLKEMPAALNVKDFDAHLFQSFKNRLDRLNDHSDQKVSVEIIAFNDPNDILSFVLPQLPDPDSTLLVKHLYLNLAQGIQINMDGSLKYLKRVDKILSGHNIILKLIAWKREKAKREFTSSYYEILTNQLKMKDTVQYKRTNRLLLFDDQEYKRFCQDLTLKHKKNVKKLKKVCEENENKYKYYHDKFNEFKKTNNRDSIIYYGNKKDSTQVMQKAHKTNFKDHKKSRISKRKLKKIKTQTILMPLARALVNGKAYQDFVVDFATAHNGPKTNDIVIKMICEGTDRKYIGRTNTKNN